MKNPFKLFLLILFGLGVASSHFACKSAFQSKNKTKAEGTFKDARDGQKYKWKKLDNGTKWMVQNLNFHVPGSVCYNESEKNGGIYGRMYDWESAKKACPSGWHLPSDDEYWVLFAKHGSAFNEYDFQRINNSKSAGQMAYSMMVDSVDRGFNFLLGGSNAGHGFSFIEKQTFYWSSITWDQSYAWRYSFWRAPKKVKRALGKKDHFGYCRCVEDYAVIFPKMIAVQGGDLTLNDSLASIKVDDFLIAEAEVTFEAYDVFCDNTERKRPPDKAWGRKKRPVLNINWYDAIRYCNWLSAEQNLDPVYFVNGDSVKLIIGANGYRLPTANEWEYAAQGGVMSKGYKYAGGNKIDDVACFSYRTTNVKSYKPNELGIYDMSGNVAEWCWDNQIVTAQQKKDYQMQAGKKIKKGGYWGGSRAHLELKYGYDIAQFPKETRYSVGIRLVRNGLE